MNYRSLLIACLATLGLAAAGWGQADGKDADNPADPSLSAGIEQAATSSGGEAWVVGAIRRLTDHSANYRSPSWSPDGQHIVFDSNRRGKADIYVMGADGSNPRRLIDDSADYRSPSWSPDGRYIAFESNRDGDWGIYVMDIASYTGGEPTAVAETSWGRIKRHLQDRAGN